MANDYRLKMFNVLITTTLTRPAGVSVHTILVPCADDREAEEVIESINRAQYDRDAGSPLFQTANKLYA